MKLTKRLRRIVDFCPKLERWADIGCDHGRTSCALILEGKADVVFAADISGPSLGKAGELSRLIGIEERIRLRLGDGFAPVREDGVQGAVLSGMGGQLILDIFCAEPEVLAGLEYMVLSPQKYPERVRKFLRENGWFVEREAMVEEQGKYYPVMAVRKGEDTPYSEEELLMGRRVEADGDYEKFLRYKIGFWSGVLEGVSEEDLREGISRKIAIYQRELKNKFALSQNV